MAIDLYAEITNRIISEMEKGEIPWRKPWMAAGKAISHANGRAYSLLNQMLLGKPGEYLTFKQVQDANGKIKKGEKAHMVVFWKWLEKKEKKDGEETVKRIPYLRYYNVFHIDQTEGVKPRYAKPNSTPANPDEAADRIIKEYVTREKLCLEYREGDAAYYHPATDRIILPLIQQFKETAEFYGTAFHEMVHSTGHKSRLNRLEIPANFGKEEYSKEELVAEIGSAALVNHVGLETEKSFKNNAAYIQSWLKALKNDKRFIVSAAGKAEKAVDYILKGAVQDG